MMVDSRQIPEEAAKPIPFSQEIRRKMVHLSSFWMVALIWFFPLPQMLLFYGLAICLVLNLLIEHAVANRVSVITPAYNFFFGKMLRSEPQPGQWVISGSTPVFASAAMVTLLFPQKIAAIALGIMLLADTAAALIGRRFGKHKTVNGKSIEGVIAFNIAGLAFSAALLACGGLLSWRTFAGALLGVFLASMAELFEKQIHLDDNFTIPLVAGAVICLSLLI